MRKLIMAVCVVILTTLAGCGATKTVTVPNRTATPPALPSSIGGHPCDIKDYTLGCALRDQQPPVPKLQLQTAPVTGYGVDFSYGGPSCAALRSLGVHIGASYLSHDPGKDWSAAQVSEYHRNGCGTVAVFESTAARATGGELAGVQDATYARTQAARLGNTRDNIDFAIDCDCAPSTFFYYFVGVHRILGSRAGAYGGYWQVKSLCASHVVGAHNWQTYAWSAGLWLPASCAPFEQWSNNHIVAGRSVDLDRAIATNYGQWPAPAVPVNPFAIYDKTKRHFRHAVASEFNTVITWVHSHCLNPVHRAVCRWSRYHLGLLIGRIDAVAHRNHHVDYRHFNRGKRRAGMWRLLGQR